MTASRRAICENHECGFDPKDWASDAKLAKAFGEPIATDVDADGAPFVALVEGAPGVHVYGSQFHPEKPLGEWNPTLMRVKYNVQLKELGSAVVTG